MSNDPKFVRISKPGARVEVYKPNIAMQQKLREDYVKAGFILDAKGNIDLEATMRAGTVKLR